MTTTTTIPYNPVDVEYVTRITEIATSLSFSSDGTWLATGFETFNLWDLISPSTPRLAYTGRTLASGSAPVLSGDGVWLAVPTIANNGRDGDVNRDVNLFEVEIRQGTPTTLMQTIKGQTSESQCSIALSADGSRLLMQENDTLANLYDLTNIDSPKQIVSKDGSQIVSLSLSADGDMLAMGRSSTDSKVLTQANGPWVKSIFSPGKEWTNMVLSADGSLVASWWDLGAEVRLLSSGQDQACSGGDFSWPSSGTQISPGRVAVSDNGGWVAMWVYEFDGFASYSVQLYEVTHGVKNGLRVCSMEFRQEWGGFTSRPFLAVAGDGPMVAIAYTGGIYIFRVLKEGLSVATGNKDSKMDDDFDMIDGRITVRHGKMAVM